MEELRYFEFQKGGVLIRAAIGQVVRVPNRPTRILSAERNEIARDIRKSYTEYRVKALVENGVLVGATLCEIVA